MKIEVYVYVPREESFNGQSFSMSGQGDSLDQALRDLNGALMSRERMGEKLHQIVQKASIALDKRP